MAGKKKSASPKKNKKTTIIHKSEKPVENIMELLGETERTIRELTSLFAELTPSKHIGIKGMPRLTNEQIEVKKQLENAHKRYMALLKLIEKKSY